jgi:hypothetical protein
VVFRCIWTKQRISEADIEKVEAGTFFLIGLLAGSPSAMPAFNYQKIMVLEYVD